MNNKTYTITILLLLFSFTASAALLNGTIFAEAYCESSNSGSSASIDLTVDGGFSPFSFQWSNGETTEDLQGLEQGEYCVTVNDALCGEAQLCITVPGDCCEDCYPIQGVVAPGYLKASIECVETSGFTYQWSDGVNTGTVNSRSNLAAGTYCVTATSSNGCVQMGCWEVIEECNLTVITDATYIVYPINGTTGSGSIDLQMNSGTPPFEFNWEGPQGTTNNTEDLSGLTLAGAYCITITDANGCVESGCINIVDCFGLAFPFTISETHSNASDPTVNDGQIDITVNGISPGNYNYAWTKEPSSIPFSTDEDVTGLGVGTYCVRVIDACGADTGICVDIESCDMAYQISINEPCPGQSNGAVNLKTNGSGDLSFLWSNGATTEDITDVTAGAYTVTMTDANDCSVVLDFNLENSFEMLSSINHSCFGAPEGYIYITIEGNGNYSYSWDDGDTYKDKWGLLPGTYCLTVTDNLTACEVAACFEIESIEEVDYITGHTFTNACGMDNGTIDLHTIFDDQINDASYDWSNGANTQDIDNLSPGNYCVTVTYYTSQCFDTECFDILGIEETVTLDTEITRTCKAGDHTGAIDLIVQGGTSPFTFQWNNGATTEDLSGLDNGVYGVTVTTAQSCTFTDWSVLTSTTMYISKAVTHTCVGQSVGAIDLGVTGTDPPFSYQWSNGASTQDINNLSVGTYCVTVTDSRGCNAKKCIGVDPSISDISSEVTNACVSEFLEDELGSIQITDVAGTSPPYSYSWSNGATTSLINGLQPGQYEVTITDFIGCSYVEYFTVENEAYAWSIFTEDNACLEMFACPEPGSIEGIPNTSSYFPFDPFSPCDGGQICCINSCIDVFNGSTAYFEEIGPAPEYGENYCWVKVWCTFAGQGVEGGNIGGDAFAVAICGTHGLQDTVVEKGNRFTQEKKAANYMSNLNIHPNPFTNEVYIEMNVNNDQLVSVDVFNQLGSIILSKKFQAVKGKNRDLIVMPEEISVGFYFVRIRDEDGNIFTKKIIKEK